DNNCNEQIDEGFDVDNDTFTACEGDCDDDDPNTNPDADEICDQADNDCDEEVDEGVPVTAFFDSDDDGFGDPDMPAEDCSVPEGYVENSDDCDDENRLIFPGAAFFDDPALCTVDVDADGYGDATPPFGIDAGTDCDDENRRIRPGSAELDSETACMLDFDDDGYGDINPPTGVTPGTDCADQDATISPGAVEICDAIDNNCDDVLAGYVPTTYDFGAADADWTFNGDAEQILDGDGYIQLTPAEPNQAGSAFLSSPVTTDDFRVSFTMEMGSGTGAEGLAFLFLDESDPTVLTDRNRGYELGAYGLSGYGIEFDTARNTVVDDPNDNHTALLDVSDFTSLANATTITGLSNGGEISVLVTFTRGDVALYLDGDLAFDHTITDYALETLLFGFSSATSSDYDAHIIDDFVLSTCQ
ncbi:MAG: MopE-related protein, partial [Myxococcota bacterium]